MAAAQTDLAAFTQLYRRYLTPVYQFCFRRLGSQAAAEDATSQTFEQVLIALPGYRHGSFRAWIFTIARNVVNDVYRAHHGDFPLDTEVEDAIVDHRPGPEEIAVRDGEAVWVRSLLAQLTDDQRQVVELRLAGLTDREIAEVLQRSSVSVRVAQHRALQRLRTLIGQMANKSEIRDEP